MPDECDRADQEVENALREAMYRREVEARKQQHTSAACFCGAEEGKKYCCRECRDMAETAERARKIRGG